MTTQNHRTLLLPVAAALACLTLGLLIAVGVLSRTANRIEALLQDQGMEQRMARSTHQMQAITLRQLNHNLAVATGLPEWQNQWSSGPLPVYVGHQRPPPQADDNACTQPATPRTP